MVIKMAEENDEFAWGEYHYSTTKELTRVVCVCSRRWVWDMALPLLLFKDIMLYLSAH